MVSLVSVCAQGGINGAVNTKGEGDHPDIHVKDTLRGGDFLAEQTSVKGMCYAAPGVIYMLDRMGVPYWQIEGLTNPDSLQVFLNDPCGNMVELHQFDTCRCRARTRVTA